MRINIENQQVKALREEVEKVVGKINGHDKFVKLSVLIEEKCKEHISITTFERLWGYSTRNANNVSERILDILAEFIDAGNWEKFCKALLNSKDSVLFENIDIINCNNLKKGDRVRLTWRPDRVCDIEYLGDYRFVAIRTENSSIKPGDTFRCFQIQTSRELYMDEFTRNGEAEESNARYVVGQINGLSSVEMITE